MLANLAIVLAAVVRFTLPGFDADTSAAGNRCAASPVNVCRDLDSVFVWAQVRWNPRAVLVYQARVRGLERQPVELPVAIDSVVTIWAVTRDTLGNFSCPSNAIALNLVAGVVPAAEAPPLEWFDVAGRRLPGKPSAPGVYFWRRGRERGVRVVLR